MRLIFIRHGEPDYSIDSLTENGRKEVEALAVRTAQWNVDHIYVSPYGRAKETAAPTLAALGQTATEYAWLREFDIRVYDPMVDEHHIGWDLMPQLYTADPLIFDRREWVHSGFYGQYPEAERRFQEVCDGLDGILREYGYIRNGEYYDFVDPTGHENPGDLEHIMLHGVHNYEIRDEDDEKTLVFFCHLGVTCVMLGHLLGISPVILWHTTCIPTTGVTVVNAEKRLHNVAHFRMQTLGDTGHLRDAGLPVSGYAAFSPLFQQ